MHFVTLGLPARRAAARRGRLQCAAVIEPVRVLRPERVIDIGPLRTAHDSIDVGPAGLHLGAFAKMSSAAEHPGVFERYPVIAQSLQLAASAQLCNMATLGGNVLQKTRCTLSGSSQRRHPVDRCDHRAGAG